MGVPTAAMACLGPQETGPAHTAAAWQTPSPASPQAPPREQIPVGAEPATALAEAAPGAAAGPAAG
ncbi:hypothetical protein WDV06_33320, partial [Streptomyces racemochromogenes]